MFVYKCMFNPLIYNRDVIYLDQWNPIFQAKWAHAFCLWI